MVGMNYVVNFDNPRTVFLLKYKISSNPLDVPQTTTIPPKNGGGWLVYNEKV